MRPVHRLATLFAALALAACSGGGGSPTGAPSAGGPAATTTAAPCSDSTGPTTVAASVAGNTWSQPVEAKVGDVITWTNNDAVPHRVGLDDGSCAMSANIAGGGSQSLVFNAPGTYPFHCLVHPVMKGVISIS
jgi:plastocyanin